MRQASYKHLVVSAVGVAGILAGWMPASAQQGREGDDIRGRVLGIDGPEAGVWVIAETEDLPTRFAKIVVTNEDGRYVVPDLPGGEYEVWVRGYGLVDSPRTVANPGDMTDLRAVAASSAEEAAQYYPAIHWFSMIEVPGLELFGSVAGGSSSGIMEPARHPQQWMTYLKTDGCVMCHQMGNYATRVIPNALGEFSSSTEAWGRRVQSGQALKFMVPFLGRMDPAITLEALANWTDRIAAGALPDSEPDRPVGIERNVVISVWDWGDAKTYLHDSIATDKRNPTINAYGPIYGSPEESTDLITVLDPLAATTSRIRMPVRDEATPSSLDDPMQPSPYWGDERIWNAQTSMHNPMFDELGRVWFTTRIRPPENPEYCREGSNHPAAQILPLERSDRQLAILEPGNGEITLIDTCFTTHHLQFAEDSGQTLWTSGGVTGVNVIGWLNRTRFEETGDEALSQGWSPLVIDLNGNGRRDAFTAPGEPVDPELDRRITATLYGVAVDPTDGTIWGSVMGFPGAVVRFIPGDDPIATGLSEIYEPPWENPDVPVRGYSPHGMDIDRNGVVWVPLASGHLGSFDRSRCHGPLNGPNATGQHCPEGWTLYPFPGPQLANVNDSGSAESAYYTWVDQFDTFGLGRDVPYATGNLNEALLALVNGEFVKLRVPYPMGFYAKNLDGRIDDPELGWKGRGLWTTTGTRAPFHAEGGKGTLPKVFHFQLRPDPLAD